MKSLIKSLVEITGPSGYESPVREFVQQEIAAHASDMRVDALGNLIVRLGEKAKDGRRIMLSAHMDEIGLAATHVDANGFVRFAAIGGVRPINCVGGRVRFMNGTQGVIYMDELHSPATLPRLDQLYIDVGASSPQDSPVRAGDVAAFVRPFIDLGNRLVSKAMDDRIAVAVLIETLKKVKKTVNELYFVFSTQEEVGLRGAATSAYGIDPEVALAVDVTVSPDVPRNFFMDIALGKGPAVKVMDSGMVADPRVVRWMADTAGKLKMPVQMEVLPGGTTDAYAIQVTRAGVITGCLSIPTRYIHSPSEMVDIRDVEQCVTLLTELVSKPVVL